jgi:carboxypeptidase D
MRKRRVCVGNAEVYRSAADETGFVVDGNTIPEVDFDGGESYAGNLPNTPSGSSSLFFWFFPSSNPDATEEVRVARTCLFGHS